MKRRLVIRWSLPPVLALLCAGSLGAQSGGTISGQVSDSAAHSPLANAEVLLGEATAANLRSTRTNAEGRYTFAGVPAGPTLVSVRLVGFAPKGQRVTVADGQTTTLNFVLLQQTTVLDQIVVTGTGGVTQRRAVGNVIETIDAKSVLEIAPARSVEQLVGSRTPGLIVLPATGQVGTGAQLRVRSVSSLSLSNDPIIYIDGVRMDAGVSRGPVQRGGAGASRLNDVNPEDIESIEVLKGPAASTLYGTEASNGVIQIITKRGRSGKAEFSFATRQGTNWLRNPEGRAGLLYGRVAATGEIISFNLYKHEMEEGNGPIFQTGQNQGYQGSMTGGTDASRYYLSAAYDDDVGVVSWNWDKKFTGRANLDILANDKLRLQGNVAHIRDRIRLAQNDIATDPFSQLVWGTPLTKDGPVRGFNQTPPETWSKVEGRADNDRTTLTLNGDFNPVSWMTHRLVTGLDVNSENSSLLYPRQPLGAQDPLGSPGAGQKTVTRTTRSVLTLDYSGAVKYQVSDALHSTTSVGLQHFRSTTSAITGTAQTFPAIPITTITGGTTRSATENYLANASVGVFVQEALAWKNRLFLTGALRGDDNSTFGKDFSAAYYPKVSASWVISEEPWFKTPKFLGLGELRFRGALGAAGTQPGTFDAQQLYVAGVGYQNVSSLVPDNFGNPALKPERSQELEVGFEATVLDGRMDLSYTHFTRKISDAIVQQPIPPSVGFPGTQVINIGRVKGWGDELAANLRVLQGQRVGLELGSQLASNGNEIEDMGGTTFLTVGGGGQAQNRVGFGIADFFMFKVRTPVVDAQGNPNVAASMCDGGRGKGGVESGGPDVSCASAPRVFWGHSQPTWQAGLNTTLTLYQRLRLYARVDGNGGHIQSNTEVRALHNQNSTEAVLRRNDPFLQVYRSIEADAPGTYKAGFLRLRELSAAYTVPVKYARMARASSASVSVAGRNLSMLWTAQDGWGTSRDGLIHLPIANQHVWDPEIRAVGQLSNGYQTIMPPTTSFVANLRLTF
jgi:TonB-linked SusC/RagA family outer membrane protein